MTIDIIALGIEFIQTMQAVGTWFITPIEIYGLIVQPIYFIFGGGLVIYLGYTVVKYFVT